MTNIWASVLNLRKLLDRKVHPYRSMPLDLLQGYWQMPPSVEIQDIFTITTPFGMFTPKGVPQGVLNATSYFQGVMANLLDGLKCKIWVDDVFSCEDTEDELWDTLDAILAPLERGGIFAAAHKCTFFATDSCGVDKCTHTAECPMTLFDFKDC